jgi:murein DD-endopeptidase / murein LD-carboxypeptidase
MSNFRKLFLWVCLTFATFSFSSNPEDSIVAFSKKQLGIKYKWAQSSPKTGFDCSGFVYYVFRHFKIEVPRAAMNYEKEGKVIKKEDCRPGDIVVFTGTNPRLRKPGHVGIIISNEAGNIEFIHASSGTKKNGVVISSLSGSVSYQKRFIKIVRLNSF